MHQEIIDYIGQAQKHGLTDFEIKQNLLSAGWEAPGVEESFVFAKAAESKPQALGAMDTPVRVSQNFAANFPSAVKSPGKPLGISNPNANITISEQHFAPGSGSGFKKSTIIILAVLLLLSIGGVAFGYYQYIYTTPEKVLAKFFAGYANSKTETVKTNVLLSYSDKNATGDATAPQEFTLGLNTDGYFDNRDAKNTKADANVKLSFKSGGTEGSMQLQYMNFAKVYFINMANIPQLKGMFGDKEVSWIKFDLEELEKYAREQIPASASSTNAFTYNQELRKKLNDIWNNAKILTPGKVLAKENLNGTAVFRLEPEVDYAKLEKAVMDSIDLIQSFQAESDLKLSDQQRSAISVLIKKFKVKEFKIWVGQKDSKLYQIKAVFAAPSVKDFSESTISDITPGMGSAKAKSRDAKRVSDIRQLASVMELYYNDFGGYPQSENGIAQGISPTFIGSFPVAPTPLDGTCTNYYNSYWYTPEGKATIIKGVTVYPSYSITFCLGDKTSSYAPGIAKLNPEGIKDAIACPSTPENCVGQNTNQPEDIASGFDKMTFGADISFEATFKDYGVVKDIKEPENAIDLIQLFKGAFGQFDVASADSKRLSDVRQISAALELYFDSNKSYPENLNLIVPKFAATVPTAPTPAEGSCSEQDNSYAYYFKDSNNYELTFCLGSSVGGYSAGKHKLTFAGIQ